MGQTLSEPVTAKESASVENSMVKVGSSCMQGWRISMEDAHVHVLNIPGDPDTMFFAVFDGHGGASVAKYAANNLHRVIINRPEYQEGSFSDAIKNGFLECDENIKLEEALREEMSGATAITLLLRNKKDVFVGNIGDSRCVASINGNAEPLSVDHKPTDSSERTRIENAGCFVEFSRVNGNLALSRAFGDFGFKSRSDLKPEQQAVCAFPDVVERQIDDSWDFFILACDGIWDVLSNQEVVDFVSRRIAQAMEPEEICEELMTRCLATDSTMGGLGTDNMTCVLVLLLNNQPYQRLVNKYTEIMKERDKERSSSWLETNQSVAERTQTPDCLSIVESTTKKNDENPSDNEPETIVTDIESENNSNEKATVEATETSK